MILAEMRAEEIREGGIEAVQPHHGLRAEIAVIVPGPARRHDEVARTHRDALAVDRSIGTLALHDETQRVGCMAVRGGVLAGQDRLQPGVQGRCDEGRSGQHGVLEHQHSPLGLLSRDQLAGAHEEGPSVLPAPDRGSSRGAGRKAHHPLP